MFRQIGHETHRLERDRDTVARKGQHSNFLSDILPSDLLYQIPSIGTRPCELCWFHLLSGILRNVSWKDNSERNSWLVHGRIAQNEKQDEA
jgi:hypothetical protein